jgi:hypothetical protein
MQTPLPDTGNVAVQAGKCLRSLKELELSTIQRGLTGLRLPDDATQRSGLVKSLATQFHERKPESWDEFVQDYLALVAIHRSAIDAEKSANAAAAARNKQMTEVLETIRNRLSFPAEPMASGAPAPAPNLRVLRSGINSPEQFDPYFKPSATALGELTGKNLFELFDEAFRLLSASGSAS